jgi:SAM-dependent methyltransferase
MRVNQCRYIGNELDLFAGARRWKAYWSSSVREYVTGDVLEVGAGFGANIPYLLNSSVRSLTLIEPDEDLHSRLCDECRKYHPGPLLSPIHGTTDCIKNSKQFDSILYVDVLEHIESDKEELELASSLLKPGGYLVVVVPAHQFLYSNFDSSIGHHRRYSRASLAQLIPGNCELVALKSLDSAGLLASLANLVLLKQSVPSESQIRVWDKYFVGASRIIDPILRFRVGKSIVAIWQKIK